MIAIMDVVVEAALQAVPDNDNRYKIMQHAVSKPKYLWM